MRYKVLVAALSFSKSSSKPRQMLESAGCELIWNTLGRPFSEEELVKIVPDVDAIIVGVDPITGRVLEAGRQIKIVAKHGVGLDNIDVDTATKLGIAVTNTPGANDDAVADLTVGFLLAVARQIPVADVATKSGNWPRLIGTQVWGKTLGLVGLGRIGRGVAYRAKGFNMRILAYDPYVDVSVARYLGVELVSFNELLSESDFVSIHVPLTEETRLLFDEEVLKKLKRGAYLINTSRGEILDSVALKRALEEGHIAGAAVDVYWEEPPKDLAWLNTPGLITTPHIGAYTREANEKMGLMVAECVIKVLRGEKAPYQVN
ncbi:MAG: phosphoglycerate dehydrogenase [Thermoanaerobacteraceae bacterium]|nr:phosphoglycerate dehydrogenase [Thermoanaerobacteraceae bacterium]